MTISTETLRNAHLGNDVTTEFAYQFRILDEKDLLVVLQNIDGSGDPVFQTLNTDYTVAGVGAADGGTIEMVSAPTSLQRVSIALDPDLLQALDLGSGGSIPVDSLEATLDNITNQQKRTRDLVLRTPTLREGDVDGAGQYDAKLNRLTNLANASLGSDAANLDSVDLRIASAMLGTIPGVIVGAGSDYLFEQLAYDVGLTGSVRRRINAAFADSINVLDFGAVGDGATDDRAAIQNAIDAAKLTGKEVFFPPGRYYIDSTVATISVDNVTLRGTNVHDGSNSPSPTSGSVFHILGDGTNPAFTFHRNSKFIGLGFWYTNQPDSATPNAHAATLFGLDDVAAGAINFVSVSSCVFFNSYIGIDFNVAHSRGLGHVWVDRNTIFGIHRAIRINGNVEVVKIESNTFTFGHMLDATEAGLRGYHRLNATAIEVYGQSDGLRVSGNLIFGANRGLSYAGGSQVFQIVTNNSFDQCLVGIYVGSTAYVRQSLIETNNFVCIDSTDLTRIGNCLLFDSPSSSGLDVDQGQPVLANDRLAREVHERERGKSAPDGLEHVRVHGLAAGQRDLLRGRVRFGEQRPGVHRESRDRRIRHCADVGAPHHRRHVGADLGESLPGLPARDHDGVCRDAPSLGQYLCGHHGLSRRDDRRSGDRARRRGERLEQSPRLSGHGGRERDGSARASALRERRDCDRQHLSAQLDDAEGRPEDSADLLRRGHGPGHELGRGQSEARRQRGLRRDRG